VECEGLALFDARPSQIRTPTARTIPERLKYDVSDPLTDRLTLLGVEQGFSVLIVGYEAELNQNSHSLEFQNSQVGALRALSHENFR
jgi:hypothetical protein